MKIAETLAAVHTHTHTHTHTCNLINEKTNIEIEKLCLLNSANIA